MPKYRIRYGERIPYIILNLLDHTNYLHRIHTFYCLFGKDTMSFLDFFIFQKTRYFRKISTCFLLWARREHAPSRELFESSPKTTCLQNLYVYLLKWPVLNGDSVLLLHSVLRAQDITWTGYHYTLYLVPLSLKIYTNWAWNLGFKAESQKYIIQTDGRQIYYVELSR